MIDEDSIEKIYDTHLVARLASYLTPYRVLVVVSVILLIVHSSCAVAGPYLTKLIIDHYLEPVDEIDTPTDTWLPQDASTGIDMIALLYLVVLACGFLARHVQILVMQHTGQQVMRDLRVKIFSHLHKMSITFFDRNKIGRLVTRTTTDVETLNEMFTSGVVAIFGDLLTLAFVLAAMIHLSPDLTMVCCTVIPLVATVSIWFRKRVRESFREVRSAVAKINSFLQEHFNGISVVQLFGHEAESKRKFDTINNEHRAAYYRAIGAHAYFYPIIDWLGVLTVAVILLYGGLQVLDGSLTIGVVVAFIQYGARVFRPIQDLSEKHNILQAAMAGAERIFTLLDTPHDQTISRGPPDASAANRKDKSQEATSFDIEFRNVSFAYTDQHWVLRNISFRIEAGKTIAFVGHTGAGKTTLTNLLLRFYEPQEGQILLGGRDIRNWSVAELRRSFGVALQDPCLLAGTIRQNICFGNTTITEQRLNQLSKDMNLKDLINSLPSGLDEPLLEGGGSLSAGEKQLISFTRALAPNPQFLILDEATSNIDAVTELKISEAFSRMVVGHTAIVIAHRLSTIQRADRIIVMHNGTIQETGTHHDLLSKQGIYWRLYQLQYRDRKSSDLENGKEH
tara:strand:- start:26771 stop:28636 length:1866 start_codon:yes stop_codon:yes gene_type:complete